MIIIGISGDPGSGKTTTSEMIFKDDNSRVVHLDRIYDRIKKNMPSFMVTHNVRKDGDEQLFLSHTSLYNFLKYNPILSGVYYRIRNIIGRNLTLKIINQALEDGIDYLILEGTSLFKFLSEEEIDFIIRVYVNNDERRNRIINRNTSFELERKDVFEECVPDFQEDVTIINDGSIDNLLEKVSNIENFIKDNIDYYCI